jgi:hypothetical protein
MHITMSNFYGASLGIAGYKASDSWPATSASIGGSMGRRSVRRVAGPGLLNGIIEVNEQANMP